MRRRRVITVSIVGGLVLVLAMFWSRSEPHYQGKSLSFWLRGFESETMEARFQSADALRHIGTNALPQLLARLREPVLRQEPAWRQRLRAILSKQSFIKINIPRPADRRAEALAALDALGPAAKDAVPALGELLNQKPPDHRALIVLVGMGQEAIPTLTRALTNDEKVIRLGARVCLNMQQTRSAFLSQKTAEDAEFMRRTCEFNACILRAAFEDYRAQHPEQVSPDGTPRPSLPPDFTPPVFPETNRARAVLPQRPSVYE